MVKSRIGRAILVGVTTVIGPVFGCGGADKAGATGSCGRDGLPPVVSGCGCSCNEHGEVVCLYCSDFTGGSGGILSTGGASAYPTLFPIGGTTGATDSGASHGRVSTEAGTSADASNAPFPGGPCGTDTCTAGQVCLSLTTVNGQYNPAGGGTGQPSTQTTRYCWPVPSACSLTRSCDGTCCQALCGGGTDAICTCGLTSTSAGCTLGLP